MEEVVKVKEKRWKFLICIAKTLGFVLQVYPKKPFIWKVTQFLTW